MPSTATSRFAMVCAGFVRGLRWIGLRLASFGAAGDTRISEILIGCAAIKNRRKSLKVKGGDHF
jgi:hypothetical protein